MIYILLSAAMLIELCIFKKKLAIYEVMCTFTYLVTYYYVQSFTILFVVYLIFSIVPFLSSLPKRILRKQNFILLIFILLELLRGIIFEPIYAVSTAFLTRYIPIIFSFLLVPSGNEMLNQKRGIDACQLLLRVYTILEVLLTTFLIVVQREMLEPLVVSHQPVGGNIAISGSFILLLLSTVDENAKKVENTLIALLYVGITLYSGTRGFIVVTVPCSMLAILNYWTPKIKRSVYIVLDLLVLMMVELILQLSGRSMFDFITNETITIGYRALENQVVISTFAREANLLQILFGFGIGANGVKFASTSTLSVFARSKFYFYHLSELTVLQNNWLTFLKDGGLFGLIAMIYFYLKCSAYCKNGVGKKGKIAVTIYYAAFAFMLVYRIGCTCSVLEMLTPVMAVSIIGFQEGKIQNEHLSSI